MQLYAPDYVVLIVEDLERSLAFYVDRLGLALNHRVDAYAQLATGRTRLALYRRDAMSATLGVALRTPDPEAPGFELGFKVEDVDLAWEELTRAGVPGITAPTTRAWGQRTAYLRDPDGHLIELAQDGVEQEA